MVKEDHFMERILRNTAIFNHFITNAGYLELDIALSRNKQNYG